jgi:DNA-binding response OmpR family regulator
MMRSRTATVSPLRGARISLVGEHDESLDAIQAHLLAQGVAVERVTFASLDHSDARAGDAIVVHLRDPHGYGPDYVEQLHVEDLARVHRVIGLIDDPTAAPAPGLLDFVLPPFNPTEVATRLQRILDEPRDTPSRTVGNLEVHATNRTVTVGGHRVEVTYQEFELLRALVEANGRVLSRDELARQLGPSDASTTSRRVDIHIHRLRARLTPLVDTRIDTVRNVGYRLTSA